MADKGSVISSLCRRFAIYSTLAEIEQLRRGLQTLSFDVLMKTYPDQLRKVFIPSEQAISAEFLQDFLEVQYSLIGSNSRQAEEAIMMNWILYIQNIEGMVFMLITLINMP